MKRRLFTSLALALMLVATLSLPAIAVTEQSTTASVTVGEVMSITLSGGISFGNITPPVTDNGTVGQVEDSPAIEVIVGSETNVNIDIGIKGEVLSGSLLLSNWKYSTDFESTKNSIPSTYTAVYTNTGLGGGEYDFYHWITVPADTTSGAHSVTVYYKAVKTGAGF